MANTERRRLTQGQAALLTRLCAVIGVLFALGGLLTLFAPRAAEPVAEPVAQAVARIPEPVAIQFPRYDAFASERGDPFAFQSPREHRVALVQPEPEILEVAVTPPAPIPDADGLNLVGTAPGSAHRFAVFADRRNGLTFVVAEGQDVRNAVLKAVYADRVVLALDEQEVVVGLTPIPGSEAWDLPVVKNGLDRQ